MPTPAAAKAPNTGATPCHRKSAVATRSPAMPRSVVARRITRRAPLGALSVRHLPLAQELEELDAFAQAAHHHLGAPHHLADDRRDLAGAEVEALVEDLDGIEDLAVREVRIVERRDLDAVLVDELRMRRIEPAVLHRLLVKKGAGIGCRERDLD